MSANAWMAGRRGAVRALLAGIMLLALIAGITWAGIAGAAPNYPELAGRITDNAHLLKAEDRAAIEAELSALESKSTDQIAVVTVPSLEGYAIEDYGIGLARKWQIGQNGKDNGILLIVAPKERKVRIEVGRKLEPVMTDTMSKIIIQNAIVSKFRQGDYSGGIRDGIRDIKAVLLGDAEEVRQRARTKNEMVADWAPYIHLAVYLFIFALVAWQIRKAYKDQQRYEASLTPSERRQLERARRRRGGNVIVIPGGSSDWSGGGWSGGGGGGGWSGGGGDFGGGGASGDW